VGATTSSRYSLAFTLRSSVGLLAYVTPPNLDPEEQIALYDQIIARRRRGWADKAHRVYPSSIHSTSLLCGLEKLWLVIVTTAIPSVEFLAAGLALV